MYKIHFMHTLLTYSQFSMNNEWLKLLKIHINFEQKEKKANKIETHIWNILSQGVAWAGLGCIASLFSSPQQCLSIAEKFCYIYIESFSPGNTIKFKLFSVLCIPIHFYCAILGEGQWGKMFRQHIHIPFLDLRCICNAIPLLFYTLDSWINNPILANAWNF